MSRIKREPVCRGVGGGQSAGQRIELDESAERRGGRIVDRQDQRIPRVDRQLIGTGGIGGVGLDGIDEREGRLIERNNATRRVRREKAVARSGDTVRSGSVVASREASKASGQLFG